mmetsp:Transcript_11299/g.24903  ORF Transcript_11299/g.24903 Transcript_11299/m.24903 type:complete len:128 (+) Transcript_11299:257-640(+)
MLSNALASGATAPGAVSLAACPVGYVGSCWGSAFPGAARECCSVRGFLDRLQEDADGDDDADDGGDEHDFDDFDDLDDDDDDFDGGAEEEKPYHLTPLAVRCHWRLMEPAAAEGVDADGRRWNDAEL